MEIKKPSMVLAVLSLCSALAACANMQQQIVSAARQPGQHLTTTPEQLWKESICRQPERPFVKVESMELLPEMIKPGGRLNYRIVYAMCPMNKFTETQIGRVTRRLSYKGQEVAQNTKETFEMSAGRWAVDAFFTLPKETPLGVYSLEVAVHTPNGQTQKLVRSFVVSNEFYLSGE
jgi:hypothetical protein